MEIFLIKAFQFMLAISLLVLLHEGGHFFFARIFGIRVEKFYLFFDWKFSLFSTYSNWWRKLRGKAPVKRKENGDYEYEGTEYGVGWIPLGGYCKIAGMIDESFDTEQMKQPAQPWEFRTKPAWQRLLVMIGGVLVNFVLALFIYSMIMYAWGDAYIAPKDMKMGMQFNETALNAGFRNGDIIIGADGETFERYDVDVYRAVAKATTVTVLRDGKETTVNKPEISLLTMLQETPKYMEPTSPNYIVSVAEDGPAKAAGILEGDTIKAVNGQEVATFNDINNILGVRADLLETAPTRADSLSARRISVVVAHANAKNGSKDTLALTLTEDMRMGVAYPSYQSLYKPTELHYSFFQSFPAGIKYGINVLGGYVNDLRYVASADGVKSLGGFGTIGSIFPAEWDWYKFWLMTAFLSIILAFMNILPIPALDGGHVLFLLYEMIFRRTPSEKFLLWAEYFGFGLLMLLMIVANLNDILRALGIM